MPIETLAEARTFVLVIEGGSLSAAARALQVSPNAVSQRVRTLEARAGVRLLNRTTRSMSLTEEGEALYRSCERLIAEVDRAEVALSAGPGVVAGRVRVAVPTILGTAALDALRPLRGAHPRLSLQLVVRDDPALDLVGTGVDLAIHYGEPVASGLILRRLGDVEFRLCATPAYLDAHGRPEAPADLARHDCLRFLTALPQDTWDLTGPDGRVTTVPVGGWFESDSSRVLGDAVYAGLGIGVRPAREIAAAGARLEAILPDYGFGRAPLVALMAPGRHRLVRVRAVLDALAEVLGERFLGRV